MKITVLGAGAYGCALSMILSENKNEVTIWTPFENEVKELTEKKSTPKLPNIKIYDNIKITNNNNLDIGIDFNDITTFALVGENINIPVASIVAQDINTLSSNSTINRELYFAISNEMFTECNGLQVNNILINGEYVNVTITF